MPKRLTSLILLAVFALLAQSCTLRAGPASGAEELARTAKRVDGTTYTAVYRFGFTRELAPGLSTRMEIVQSPPVVLRKVDTSTRHEDGTTATLSSWHIRNEDGDFVCTEYAEVGVRCMSNPIARGTFGSDKLDVFFDSPRNEETYGSVRRVARPVRIQDEPGTCFEAVPSRAVTSPDRTPEPGVERFRYEFCYSEDGVLLRGREIALDEAGTSDRFESFVEIISLSRVVDPADLALPGPVVEPADLPG